MSLLAKSTRNFRCRWCSFSTEVKSSYWIHSRSHMRPNRILQCSSCEFVTEHRHHLDYHQSNHTNSKPFACDKCAYRCVNRSMLNSHLKSHSAERSYRCADCCYATKYRHSLVSHLRKCGHRQLAQLRQISVQGQGSAELQHAQQQQDLKPHLTGLPRQSGTSWDPQLLVMSIDFWRLLAAATLTAAAAAAAAKDKSS